MLEERIISFVSSLGGWSYLILFLMAFFETTLFTGIIVPGDTIVVIAGFLCSRGTLQLPLVLLVVGLGALVSYPCGYLLGRFVGARSFERKGRFLFLTERSLTRVNDYFRDHGGKTILFSRFISFLRSLAPFAAGISRMPAGRFLAYSCAGALLWTGAFVLLGFFFGESWNLVEKWLGRAGLFLFFLLLIAVGFAFLYRTLVKNQDRIFAWARRRAAAVAALPPIQRIIEANPALVAFARDRLSPTGYLGLHLTLGLAISAVFIWLFGSITEAALRQSFLARLDQEILQHVRFFHHPWVSNFMLAVTELGGAPLIGTASLALVAYFLGRRRVDFVVAYLAGMAGGSVLVYVLKQIVHRARPAFEPIIGPAYKFSLPSGHVMMAVIFYGLLLYFMIQGIRSWRLGVFLFACTGFLIFLIGFARIYLMALYFSDVLAGLTGGLFWLTMCVTGLEVDRRMVRSRSA